LGLIFAQHIRFTKKYKEFAKQHYCRGQRVEFDRFHEVYPPAGCAAINLWIKIIVLGSSSNEWGGAPLAQPTLIICHFDKTLAASKSVMPIFEVPLGKIMRADKGLLLEFDNN
jgi:hypothetical protein